MRGNLSRSQSVLMQKLGTVGGSRLSLGETHELAGGPEGIERRLLSLSQAGPHSSPYPPLPAFALPRYNLIFAGLACLS